MKPFYTPIAILSLLLALPVAAHSESYSSETDIQKDEDGDYEKTTTIKAVDDLGTSVKKKISTEVDVDAEGNRETVIKSKSSYDPKGLMNKTTVESESKVKEEDGVTETTYEREVNGETVEREKKVQ